MHVQVRRAGRRPGEGVAAAVTGILGGAFNPPHVGHLVLAQEALVRLGLERVVLMPMGVAPHRVIEGDPGAEVRAQLCERAVVGDPRFEVSRLEVERDGPSFTVDTLREMRSRSKEDLVLLLGGDQAAALPSWREPGELMSLARVAVAEREGFGRERVRDAVSGLGEVEFFDMPLIGVSSSIVRERVAAGEPVRYLVPSGVNDAIAEQGLYREAGS